MKNTSIWVFKHKLEALSLCKAFLNIDLNPVYRNKSPMNRFYSLKGLRISISHRSSTSITITIGSGSNSDSTLTHNKSRLLL